MRASLVPVFVLLFCCSFCKCRHVVKENEIPSSDGCEVENAVYKVGEQWSKLGECMLFTCHENGAYGAVTCPSVTFRENSGCYETEMDNTKLYPDCCPKVICPKSKGLNKIKGKKNI